MRRTRLPLAHSRDTDSGPHSLVVAETVQEHRQDAYAMVQYESACIERELWRERERKLGGLWDAGDSPNVDALCLLRPYR